MSLQSWLFLLLESREMRVPRTSEIRARTSIFKVQCTETEKKPKKPKLISAINTKHQPSLRCANTPG